MKITFNNIDWGFIGAVIIPAVGLFLTVVIYYLQRQSKKLSYGITSAKLVDEERDVHEIVIKYKNTGSVPITNDDLISDITTIFIGANSGTEVLNVETLKTWLYNPVKAKTTFSANKGYVRPDLLNPQEFISTKFLVKNFNKKIYVTGRLIGISNIGNFIVYDFVYQMLSVLFFCLLVWGVALVNNFHFISLYVIKTDIIICLPIIIYSIIKIRAKVKEQYWLFKLFEIDD